MSVTFMRPLSIFGLSILIILAGCTAGPFGGTPGQEGQVPVIVNNSANTTHTFGVWVAEGELNDREIEIRKKGGEVDRASPGEGLSTYKLDDDYGYVTSIELPPNRTQLQEQYTLDPGENNQIYIKNFKTDSTIVVVIYEGDRVVSLVAAHCGGDLAFLEVTMFYYGSGSSYNCVEGFF